MMIIRKLRQQKNWTQEQLAIMSGLNVRTIQRVETGQKASLETLKCLASVFQVDMTTLTKEITVIDKESEQWLGLPWWFKANMFGVNSRRHVLTIEFILLAFALACLMVKPSAMVTPVAFLMAYLTGWLVRYGDKHQVW